MGSLWLWHKYVSVYLHILKYKGNNWVSHRTLSIKRHWCCIWERYELEEEVAQFKKHAPLLCSCIFVSSSLCMFCRFWFLSTCDCLCTHLCLSWCWQVASLSIFLCICLGFPQISVWVKEEHRQQGCLIVFPQGLPCHFAEHLPRALECDGERLTTDLLCF